MKDATPYIQGRQVSDLARTAQVEAARCARKAESGKRKERTRQKTILERKAIYGDQL
jgi:hypothetical protein